MYLIAKNLNRELESKIKEKDQELSQRGPIVKTASGKAQKIEIIAHDLTDYVFERKTWNYYDYLTHYARRFKGGIFDEIYNYIEKAREAA